MKNVKFNLYTENEIPETHLEYFRERLSGKNHNIPEFLKGKAEVFYECQQDKDYTGKIHYYIENTYIIVVSPAGNLCMLEQHRNDKYYFHPYHDYHYKFHDIDYHIKNEATGKLKEPNAIGVFTDKKVNDWLTYCDAYLNALEELFASFTNNHAELDAQVKTFIDSVPGAEVSTYQNTINVATSLFNVVFEINVSTNYLYKKVVFTGTLKDISEIESLLKTA